MWDALATLAPVVDTLGRNFKSLGRLVVAARPLLGMVQKFIGWKHYGIVLNFRSTIGHPEFEDHPQKPVFQLYHFGAGMPNLPPSAHKPCVMLSGSSARAGGGFLSIAVVLASPVMRKGWPFMASAIVGAAGSAARSADNGAALQGIPHGNHGDNLRSVQK